jgi:hypothetical protein
VPQIFAESFAGFPDTSTSSLESRKLGEIRTAQLSPNRDYSKSRGLMAGGRHGYTLGVDLQSDIAN